MIQAHNGHPILRTIQSTQWVPKSALVSIRGGLHVVAHVTRSSVIVPFDFLAKSTVPS